MIATIRLEAIGDSCVALGDALRKNKIFKVLRLPAYKQPFVFDPGRRPWVARLTGVDRNGNLKRAFLDPNKDYREAKKSGDHGVYCTFVLRSGNVYEVHELINWTKRRRFFCFVDANGDAKEIELEEVLTRLSPPTTLGAMQGIIDQAAGAK